MRFGTPIHAFRDDILNSKLTGLYDVVYSWGVLHHTGNMWAAIDKAARLVAPGGIFILALYSSNVATPSTEFWLDVKRRYNAASPSGKRRMEWWYVWRFGAGYGNPLRVSLLLYQIWKKRKRRGMRYMTDVRDWLGGWPMEYADDQEVVETLKNKFGMDLEKIFTGEACTEFMFRLRP
jgi:2-polyprenyl-6-hydroxyphenyl methylase/3-demethylubiquinone-9 3-methyltransferase